MPPKSFYTIVMRIFVAILLFMGWLFTPALKASDTTHVVLRLPVDTNFVWTVNLTDAPFGAPTIPFTGKVISKFGKRGSRQHTGTDIKLSTGDSIFAAFDGIVDIAKWHYGYGLLVTLNHPNCIQTYYGHLSKIGVQPGDTLTAGTFIGLGGRTGRATTAHLHFEIRVKKEPINPEIVFDFESGKIISRCITISPYKKPVSNEPNVLLAGFSEHKIAKGDTLYSLAKRYNTSVKTLCKANNISPDSKLRIGQVLLIE